MNTSSALKFPLFQIDKILNADPDNLLGYYIASTAKINIEEPRLATAIDPSPTIQQIAEYLVASSKPEITISIHGYATNHQYARERTDKIYHYAQQICQPQTHVLFGYLWPSENPIQDDSQSLKPPASILQKIQFALQALPTALIGTVITTLLLLMVTLTLSLGVAGQDGIIGYLLIGIIPAIAALGILKIGDAEKLLPGLPIGIGIAALLLTWLFRHLWQQAILSLGLVLFGFGFTLIFTLIGLRLATYFRDQYRAANYAVLDMVELIRQLDQAILQAGERRGIQESHWKLVAAPESTDKQRVKLNILGHSMGCFVTTQAIRILSDVFDPLAIEENPDSKLGKTLCLGRLVLAAADISTESIMPGRSNVLKSSLRRCEEAYLFTNEGDLALRLASTAANYFSFPSRSRFFGYRLGNVTAQHFPDRDQHQNHHLDTSQYGIVNSVAGFAAAQTLRPLYNALEIRSSNQEHRNLQELNSCPLREPDEPFSPEALVNCFSVFDCTDYRDYKLDPGTAPQPTSVLQPIVSHALRQAALNLLDYLRLSIDFFITQRIDTHGGYFQGQFSQQLMYELSLLGFEPLLLFFQKPESLSGRTSQAFRSLPSNIQGELLHHFATVCQEKQLQVVLSPKRFS
ncbi:MAG: alpha/beta hydrolase [Chroococcidiopsidaceae cyanobacterium CP_BM_ER_R8_30]|nr:alpha/beta hydrolase [Chroococcidiopsidaceae cyanobacterium CP_BM_ER_R8_30]